MQEVKDFVKKNVKKEISAKDERILLLKEAKVNTLKCLRKFTKFSKDNYEDLLQENFVLKKNLLDRESQIKILKVALLKMKHKQGRKDPREDFEEYGDQVKEVKRAWAEKKEVKVVKSSGGKKAAVLRTSGASNKSGISTVSTDTTLSSGDSRFLKVQQDLLALRKQFNEREHEHKIQMARMKNFYDKHLEELNMAKLKKNVPAKPAEKITSEKEKDALIRQLRAKVRSFETLKYNHDKEVKEKEEKITDLKNRIANQGFTKLTKQIEDLHQDIVKRDERLVEKENHIKKIDCLEYQLEDKYQEEGPTIRKLVSYYLKIKALWNDPRSAVSREILSELFRLFKEGIIDPLHKVYKSLCVFIREKLLNQHVDYQALMLDQIKDWRENPKLADESLKTAQTQIAKLNCDLDDLQRQNEDYKNKFDTIVNLKGDYRTVLGRFG